MVRRSVALACAGCPHPCFTRIPGPLKCAATQARGGGPPFSYVRFAAAALAPLLCKAGAPPLARYHRAVNPPPLPSHKTQATRPMQLLAARAHVTASLKLSPCSQPAVSARPQQSTNSQRAILQRTITGEGSGRRVCSVVTVRIGGRLLITLEASRACTDHRGPSYSKRPRGRKLWQLWLSRT